MRTEKLNLTDIEKIPVLRAETLENFGRTLIVAPHPDDESLGCGGLIAVLREKNVPVSILILSDGTLSHPNSKKFPSEKLRDLRETELLEASEILGVEPENIEFLRFPDRHVPSAGTEDFARAVESIAEYTQQNEFETVFVPWRRDPHPDHRAAFQLIDAAKNFENVEDSENSAHSENSKKSKFERVFEYPIWLFELAESADAPLAGEARAFRVKIETVLEKKRRAIFAHRSQTTDLIDDDPEGFRLTAEILEDFLAPFEIYFASNVSKKKLWNKKTRL